MRSQFLIPALSLVLGVTGAAQIEAERILPVLIRRQDGFTGGWSLRQMTCPAGSFECPRFEGMPACCPEGTECKESYTTGYNYVACCPKGKSCQKTIHALPVCANPDWILYTHKTLYKSSFCCLAGQKAYVTTQNGEHPACGPENLAVESSNVASTIRPATALEGTAIETQGTAKTTTPSQATKSHTVDGSSEDISSDSSSKDGGKSSESKANIPIGAVIGGVIGGVAVLGLIVLGFFYVARTGRQKSQNQTDLLPGQEVQPVVAKIPEPVYAEQGLPSPWSGPTPPQAQSPYQSPMAAPSYPNSGSELDSRGAYRQGANQAPYQELDGVGSR